MFLGGPVSLYDQPFQDTRLLKIAKNRKCTKLPQNDPEHVTAKSTLYIQSTCPQGSNFVFNLLYDQPLPVYKGAEIVTMIQKCTKWSQNDLQRLTVKITQCASGTYIWGSNFGPFRSTANRFREARFPKIRSVPNEPRRTPGKDPEHLTVKSTLHTKNVPSPEVQILVIFTPWPTAFEIQWNLYIKTTLETNKIWSL